MSKETLPHLTEDAVRRMTDGRSFERGEDYYSSGAIVDPVRQGMELRAECQGSQYEPYRVRVTLNEKGIASYDCSCPRGGFCKHVVALMLTYVHEPESFREIPPLETLLAPRSKEELIALIGEMVKLEPHLMSLVEMPATPRPGASIDAETYRRRVRAALRRREPFDIERELNSLCDTARRLAQSGDWLNAGVVYQVMLTELSDHYEDELSEMDEDGDIAGISQDCAQGLGECLAQGQPDAATRREWLTALLNGELADIALGGIDFAAGALGAILEQATDEDWAWIEPRVRAEIEKTHSDWARQSLVRFLVARRGEDAADIIRELGTLEQQAMLLVREKKFAEAVAMAREHFTDLPGLMIQFADALVKAGAGAAAVELLTEQTEKKNSYYGYVEWLAKHFREHGDPHAALDWQRKVFAQSSSVEAYKTLREVSQKMGVWEQTRADVLESLEREKKIGALIDVALHEGDVARALELLPRVQESGWGYGWSHQYKERVAKAAEKNYPESAIALYKQLAEHAIEGKSRGFYQTAAQYLQRVKSLHERLNTQTEWESYIHTLRARYPRLPALHDELRKAKL